MRLEALANEWRAFVEKVVMPIALESPITPAMYNANEMLQEQIREHVVASKDESLMSLLHLLGLASLQMEQMLWPEAYKRIENEIEEAIRKDGTPSR